MPIPDQKELTQGAHGDVTARFILDEARALDIRIGCALDGSDELIMVAPLKVPRDVRCWFETKLNEFREQIIDLIQRKNAGGRS